MRFLSAGRGAGRGAGDGDGYGSGYGAGRGYGAGDGYGRGAGYGRGDGYGDGYGDGAGRGSGSGSGSGYGSGRGYGSGYGWSIKSINGFSVHLIDGVPTTLRLIALDDDMNGVAIGRIVRGDLTMEKTYVVKRNGQFAHGSTLDEAVEAAEEKVLEKLPVEERIDKFLAEFPLPDVFASGAELFKWHHVLTGSCRQGREMFCKEHGLSLEAEYTISQFVAMTLNAYGGDVIAELRDRYIALQQQGGVNEEEKDN